MKLTKQEIRVRVAELCGYTNVREPIGPSGQCGVWWGDRDDGPYNKVHQIPNYPEDLNACASFEATIPADKLWSYGSYLRNVMTAGRPIRVGWPSIVIAPALARCLAFLRLHGIEAEVCE